MRTKTLRSLLDGLGSKAAKWAACLLATVTIGSAWAEEINVIDVPELTVTTLDPADDSLDWRGQLTPVNVALHYELSADVLAAHQEEFFAIAEWNVDWVLTSSEELTLVNPGTSMPSGMTREEDASPLEGGFIAGKITENAEWVYVPWGDSPFTLEANTGYRVLGQISPGGIIGAMSLEARGFVENKGFGCSLYLTTAYRMAHPNVVITLEPILYNPDDPSKSYSLGEAKRFTFGLPDAPEAVVTKNTAYNKEVNLVPVNNILGGGYQYGTVTPNVAYTFEAKDTSEEASSGKYASWKCDYVVSMDADTDAYSIGLFGQYGWGAVAFPSPVDAKAGQKIPLLMSVTKNGWNYSEIVNMVRSFTCGAINFSEENIGKTITVSLVMWNEDNPVYKSYENPYVVEEIKYKFETVTPLFASVSQGAPAVPVVYRKNTADEYGFSVDEDGYPVVENEALVIKSFNVGEPHFAMVADNAVAKTSDSSYSTADEAVATVEDNKEITVNISTSIGSEAAPAGSTVTTTTGTAVTAGTDSAAETTVTPKTVTITSGTGSEQTDKTVEAYVVSQGSGEDKKFSVVTDVSKDETIVSAGKTVVSDFVKPAAVIANAVASENLAADKVSSMVLSLVKTEAESSEPGLDTALVTAIGAADKAFEVHPVATITTTTEEGTTATTSYAVANSELAENASFTFTLDFGVENAGKAVTLTHYASDGTQKGDSWVETVGADGLVSVTLESFSYLLGTVAETSYYVTTVNGRYEVTTTAPSGTPTAYASEEDAVAAYQASAVAKIGSAYYATLQEAISAAQDGDTIEFLSDIVWDSSYSAYYEFNVPGSVTIDGKGYTLSAPATGGPTDSAIMLGDSSSSGSSSVYTVTNMTFSGFTSISHSVLRAQGVTAKVVDCTFTGNASSGEEWGVVTANNGANVTVKGCTFRGNAGTKCVDVGFNVAAGSSMAVDNCLFEDNILTGHGVIYVASGVTSASIQNCTFTNNAVTASGAAVVYCSGTTTIAGNLFADNRVTSSGKEGVIVLGGGATGTVVGGNAFVDNELDNAVSHYATVYTGSNCNLAGNYWGEGAAPEVEDHADVYASGELAINTSTFASAYAVNDDGCGVTVTIASPVVTFLLRDEVGDMTIQYDSSVYTIHTQAGVQRSGAAVYNYMTQTVANGDPATEPAGEPSYWYHSGKTFPVGNNTGIPFTVEQSRAYVFDGWRLSGESVRYDFSTPVTSDITLVPHFSAVEAVFEIYTEADLFAFAREVALGRSYRSKVGGAPRQTVKLMNNITLTSNWTPIPGNFHGIFDGNGYAISGLVINDTTNETGFFRTSGKSGNGFVVTDLTFQNPSVTSSGSYVGVLVGQADCVTVANVTVNNPTVLSTSTGNVGGLVGSVNNNVSDNSASASVFSGCSINGGTISCTGSDGRIVGGLIGQGLRYLTVTNCSVSNVTINGYRRLGGLIGLANGAHLTCTDASVSGVTLNALGTTSYASGDLTMGGLVGQFATPTESTFTGTVSDLTMTGPESIASGKNYIMGLVSGGTAGTAEAAENAMTAANMTFDVTISGTNTTTINTESSYAGINGNPSVTYVAQIVRNDAVFAQYETITAAIVAAESGDTIQLLPGTYGNVDLTHIHGRFQTETYQGGIFAPNVTILGGEGVTVDGIYFNGRIIPDNWTIKNVTFSGNGTQSGFHFVNGSAGVSGLTVDGCKFLGGCFLSLPGGTAVNTVVANCLFDGVAATGSGGSSAIYIPSPDGLTVTGCTIRNGAYNAIQTFPKTGSADVIITGNTFQGVNSRIINMANATTGHTGTITISGNTFYMPVTRKSDGNYVRCGKAISIGENTYEEDPSSDNWSYYFLPSDLTVTAGTFANDVSTHVADGYKAVANGTNPETWTVVVLPTYTVTFDLNAVMAEPTQAGFFGGNLAPDSTVFTQGYLSTSPTTRYKYTVAVKEGETVPKPFNANGLQVFPVRRDGYIFDGWQLNGVDYDFTTPVAGEITLTAKWKAYTDSITIANAEEFLSYASMFSASVSFSGVTITLTDDIAFTETLRPWAPLAGFSGTLDGANHKITGLNVNATSDYVGLFYQLNSGSICNLTIESPTVTSTGNHVGALAGTCSIPLNNVHVIGNISVTGKDNVGGISGKAGYGASYTNCSVVGSGIETAVISGTGGAIVGGLISETGNMANGPLTITGCRVSNVTVVGVRKIGGLIGQVDGHNLTCTDAEVSNVKLVSNAETSLNKDLPMGGFVGAFVNSRYTNDIFSGTVSDITMTGPAELSSGKNYIMGLVSGGTGKTVAEAETAMTDAGMTFDVTVSGTNTRTVETVSSYEGINGSAGDYVTLSLTFDSTYAGDSANSANIDAANAAISGKRYASMDEAQIAYMALYGYNYDETSKSFTSQARTTGAPLYNSVGDNSPKAIEKVTFSVHGTVAGPTLMLGQGVDSQQHPVSVDVIGVGDNAQLTGNAKIQARVAGGYDTLHTTSGKLLVKDIEFTETTENITVEAGCAKVSSDSSKTVEASELEVTGCKFHTELYAYSNAANGGHMTYNIHDNVFSGSAVTKEAYAFCLQGGDQGDKGPNVINFYNNTVSGYKRGIQLQPNSSDPTMKKTVNVYGNTITPGTGYSAVQITAGNEVNIYNNTIILNAANAITLHGLLTDGIAISFTGNTVSLANGANVGYIVYDDAQAANNTEALARSLTMTYTGNTVATGVSTTQGVKGSNVSELRPYVYYVLNGIVAGVVTSPNATPELFTSIDAAITRADEVGVDEVLLLGNGAENTNSNWKVGEGNTLVRKVYVAQIGANKYETLAAAIAEVPTDGTATTITLLKDVSGETIAVNGGRNVVLDLGKHELTPSLLYVLNGALEAKNGTIKNSVYVYGLNTDNSGMSSTFTLAQDATIASKNGVILYNYPNTKKAYDATVNINGTVLGNVWVMGNITEGDSVINVAGTVDATGQSDVGIALNGNATVNVVDGAVVTSKKAETGLGTGIEVRAGTLNVTGGTIAGQGSPVASTGNESGTTSAGAGIAVSTYEISDISVNISGGTVTGYAPLYFVNTKGTTNKELDVAVTGGTFTANNGGTSAIFVDESEAERVVGFVANGETTTPVFSSAVAEEYCATGFIPKDNGAGKYGVKAGTYVAQIGTTKYETLAAAVAEVQDGQIITMLANSTEASEPVLALNGSVTLDLNGKTVTANGDIWVKTGSLTVVGSTGSAINSSGYAFYVSTQSIANNVATLTINSSDVAIHGDTYGVAVMSGGVVNLQAGSISSGHCAITGNGSNAADTTINITGGTVTCDGTAIYHPGPGTLTVGLSTCDGGEGHSHPVITGKTGIEMRAGTLNVYCGDITATAAEFAEQANGSGSTITGAAVAVSQHSTDLPIGVNISGGTLNGIYGVYEKDLQNPETGADVVIAVTGGEISGTTSAIAITDIASTTENVGAAVSGGSFSSAVPEEYCADGYIPAAQDPETGTYTVKQGAYVAQNTTTGVKYETLAAAIEAAPTTGVETTIMMIDDSVEAGTITIAGTQNIVLDLAGRTVSYSDDASSKSVYFITNKGVLTMKDTGTNGSIVFTANPHNTNYSYETVTIYNLDGTLNLQSGKVINASAGGLAYAVNNSSNAWGKGDDKETVFNMTGGVLSAPNGDAALRVYQNCAQNSDPYSHNTVRISDGTILDTGIFLDNNIYQAAAETTGEGILIDVEITGGTINGLIDLKLRHAFNTSFTVTGGDFTNTRLRVRKQTDSVHVWSVQSEPTKPVVAISGGKFSFVDAVYAFNTSSAWTTTSSWTSYKPYAVSGGVFSDAVPETACATGYMPIANTDTVTKEAYPYTVGEKPLVIETATESILDITANSIPHTSGQTVVFYESNNNGADWTALTGNPKIDSLPGNGVAKTYKFKAVVTEGNTAVKTYPIENTVGILHVADAACGKTTIIGVPWFALGEKITADSLVYLDNRDAGDKLMAYDEAKNCYWTWELKSKSGESGLAWTKATTIKDNEPVEGQPEASEFVLKRGQGLFLTRENTNAPIYLVGRADGTGTTTTTLAASSANKPTWTLVAAPSTTPLDLNAKTPVFGSNFSDQEVPDAIVLPTGGAGIKVPYTYKEGENGGWGRPVSTSKTINGKTYYATVWSNKDATIPAGVGFWYLNNGEEAKSVEW